MAYGKKQKQLQYDINHPNYGNLKECGMKNYRFTLQHLSTVFLGLHVGRWMLGKV